MSSPKPQLFLLGTGFIGGSVLSALLASGKYEISALARSEKSIKGLEALGVHPVRGTLADHDVIKNQVLKSDVVIHAATADDLPSVQAILDGIAAREDKTKKIVYLHTSGTGVLTSSEPSVLHDDARPETLNDNIPDAAPHREIDLTIKKFIEEKKGGDNARIAILMPPLIYGVGTGPFNTISIQVPNLIRTALKLNQPGYSDGRQWNVVHIKNLVPAYLTILSYLENLPSPDLKDIYFFAEQGTTTWKQIAEKYGEVLFEKGLVPTKEAIKWEPKDLIEKAGWTEFDVEHNGSHSHSKASRLATLGWKPDLHPTVLESIPEELEVLLKNEPGLASGK